MGPVAYQTNPKGQRGSDSPHALADDDIQLQVETQIAAIRGLNGSSLADKVDIGRRLVSIRQAVGWFQFQPLVGKFFGWTKTTTSNYMHVAGAFGKRRPHRLARFDWSALVVLSRGCAPRSARAEALLRSRAGQNIGKELAEAIVARHRDVALPDPVAERLVNRVYLALKQLEKHHACLNASQRDRVALRLTSLANLLISSPIDAEPARTMPCGSFPRDDHPGVTPPRANDNPRKMRNKSFRSTRNEFGRISSAGNP